MLLVTRNHCSGWHVKGGDQLRLRMERRLGRLHLRNRTLLPFNFPDHLVFCAINLVQLAQLFGGRFLVLDCQPGTLRLLCILALDICLTSILLKGLPVVRKRPIVVDVLQHVLVREEVLTHILRVVQQLSAAFARLEQRLVASRVFECLFIEVAVVLENAGLFGLVADYNFVITDVSVVDLAILVELFRGCTNIGGQ